MCRIKEGAAVQTKGDLQNLVTSVILRQTSTFSAEDIYQATRAKLEGSEYRDRPELKQRCMDTISTLFVIDCIRSVGKGIYSLAMSFPAINGR